MTAGKKFTKLSKRISLSLKGLEKKWDGKNSITKMKVGGSKNWRQMEWIGFYFEFLCQNVLNSLDIFNKKNIFCYGNSCFDGFLEIPWDFKAHAINTNKHEIIVNDKDAIEKAIAKYGMVGVILAIGEVRYNDEKGIFKRWHDILKGGKSNYEKMRIKRGAWSRKRKTEFILKQIIFIKITKSILRKAGQCQKGFRNSNGTPRKTKVLVNLEKLQERDFYSIEF